jgi:UPF0716 protein FxsA
MLIVVLLLVIWPVAELYVLIKVAEAIGILLTLLLLVASWPLGSWALRSQGRAALDRLAAAMAERRPPGREVLDGVLILIGGVLLMIPGFISDAFGAVMLLPPTRALVRRGLVRNLRSRIVLRAVQFGSSGRVPSYDVDSTARDVDQPQLKR